MVRNQYQAQQLATLLKEIQSKQGSGTLYLAVEISQKKRHRVLVWKDGQITYGGLKVPSNQEFAKMLGQKFKREKTDTAINLAMQKATQTSIKAFLELLVKMQLFTWEQIESLVHTQVVLTLEQVLPYGGQFQFDSTTHDLCYGESCRGLDWSKLTLDLTRRQEQWSALVPLIPSMEAVPHLQPNALQRITDPTVGKHLQQLVDGQRSLVDIAEKLDKDPLHIAQSYLRWVQEGWVVFYGSTSTQKNDLPTILAVDDSPVMQTMIKRALADRYHVLVASNAADALNLIQENEVALVLLDVSMPEIDGLELCRLVRNMSQFHYLPIIMLTARDGYFDKVKGQIAGATEYLIKPFDAEKLLQVVEKYVCLATTA